MATTPAQRRLAEALSELKSLQDGGRSVLRTEDLRRPSREALIDAGFLQPIIGGWYMCSRPGAKDGDTTAWVAHAREFVSRYAQHRFGDDWSVDPDYSIKLHTGSNVTPKQIIIHSPAGNNSRMELPFGYSIFVYKTREPLPVEHIDRVQDLRAYSLPYALTCVSAAFFRTSKQDALVALRALPDASDLNRVLIETGQAAAAGRLAGALRASGRADLADEIVSVMRDVGHRVEETNPFAELLTGLGPLRKVSPYVDRLDLMWRRMRDDVLAQFSASAQALPTGRREIDAVMERIEERYVTDAYHSLSIEGYRVTEDLIRKVADGSWNPDEHAEDLDAGNAMAAHGYWKAHNAVKDTIRAALESRDANIGSLLRKDHGRWYRELFSPSVDARIIKAADLAGYRSDQVYIKNAEHVPPPRAAVRDLMPAFFDLMKDEQSPAVRAVLGHFAFVFIHPYMDGNGRIARFLMNAVLCAAGFPWTVIRLDQRPQYFGALNDASARGDIRPFGRLISECVVQNAAKPEVADSGIEATRPAPRSRRRA